MSRISIIITESPDGRYSGIDCKMPQKKNAYRIRNPRRATPEEKLLKKIFGERHEYTEHRH